MFIISYEFHEVKIRTTFVFSERHRDRRRVRTTTLRDGLVPGRDEILYRRRLCSSVTGPRTAPGQLYSLQELEETSDQGMSLCALETSCSSSRIFSLHFFSHLQVFLLSVVFCSFSNELVVIPNVFQERCITLSQFYPREKIIFKYHFDGTLALIVAIIN